MPSIGGYKSTINTVCDLVFPTLRSGASSHSWPHTSWSDDTTSDAQSTRKLVLDLRPRQHAKLVMCIFVCTQHETLGAPSRIQQSETIHRVVVFRGRRPNSLRGRLVRRPAEERRRICACAVSAANAHARVLAVSPGRIFLINNS